MKLQRFKKLVQASGIIAGLAIVAFALGTLFNLNGSSAAASDCSANAIMTCGASDPGTFVNKIRSSNDGKNPDLATIYAAYGLTAGEYDRFATTSKAGTAYKDGRIVVDGKVVATNASSIGRVQKSGDHAKVIGGTTYWEGSNQTAFASDSIPVEVMFDGNGTMEFAVLFDCGNPVSGNVTPPPPPPPPAPTPTAACTGLTVAGDNRTTFTLNASAAVTNGATISGYDFSVANSAGTVVATKSVASANATASTQVTLNDAGTYRAKVTVQTSLGPKTASACEAIITVNQAPAAACKLLTATGLDRTTYRLDATADVSGGATVQGYDFVVKNSAGTVIASPSVSTTATTASTNVTASEAGTYTAQVTVRTSEGAKTSGTCTANFTVPEKPIPPVPSIKIVKDVDGVKQKQVAVGQNFVYHVTVSNNGKVDLTSAVVTDQPPAGVTLLSADKGTIANNTWTYTIPSLKIGESASFALTAKVDAYIAGNLVNTACVVVPPTIPEKQCDTATVSVTPPVTPPPVLPSTGAGSVVGIFATTVIFGALAYRFFIGYRLNRQ
ncbi:DUF11 domain-containing protein [Candidatus Saccharibacteria bacterium]|nr:MAG: DUF11 domain-containing protein [Candidatus Saccharibacteria bacterium]